MIRVNIDTRDIERELQRLHRQSSNLLPVMTEIAGHMADAVEENFEKEGRPGWKPLADSTLKARARKGKTGKILQVTGGSGLAGSVSQKATKNRALVGTNKAYAARHQFGYPRGSQHKTPARPFLNLQPSDLGLIQESIKGHLLSE